MSQKTIRNLIISSVLLLIALGALGFVVYKINAQGHLLREQVKTIGVEQAQKDSFYRLQRSSEDSAADREKLGSYFLLDESDSIDLLTRIESLAPQAGVTLKEFEGLQTIEDKTTNSHWIEVKIFFSGEEMRVRRFVEVLEQLPYLLEITSLELSSQSSTLWQANVTLRVSVLTYDK
jgi:hypothetical protein